jgi:hypothetical protein
VPLPATKNPTELASKLFLPSLWSSLETKSLSVTPEDPAPFVRDPRYLIDSLTFIRTRLYTSPVHFQGHQAFPFSPLSSAPSPFSLSFHALPFFYLSSLPLSHITPPPAPAPSSTPRPAGTFLLLLCPDPLVPAPGGSRGGREGGREGGRARVSPPALPRHRDLEQRDPVIKRQGGVSGSIL